MLIDKLLDYVKYDTQSSKDSNESPSTVKQWDLAKHLLDELNRLGRNAFKDDADYDSLFIFVEALQVVKPKGKVGY